MQDFRVEQLLNEEQVAWRYERAIPLDRIDLEASRKNQARLEEPLNADMVDRYARSMRRKAQFPAIVVVELGGRFVVLGGNHRVAAALKISRAEFDAYVVESNDRMVVERITWMLNNAEGVATSPADAMKHGIAYVMLHQRTVKEAAQRAGVSKTALENALRQLRLLERAQRCGMDKVTRSVGTLAVIQTDAVFADAVRVANGGRLSESEVRELRDEITHQPDEAAQRAVLARWKDRPAVQQQLQRTGKSGAVTARRELFRLMSSLTNLVSRYPTAFAYDLTPAEADEMRGKLMGVENMLTTALFSATPANGHAAHA